jgi:hypothetical protein
MLQTSSLGYCLTHAQEEPCSVCLADRQEGVTPPPSIPSSFFGDRELAIVFRASLIEIIHAIKEHGPKTYLAIAVSAGLKSMVAGIERRWNIKPKR